MAAWKLVNCLEAQCSSADFHSGVNVWLTRPGVVNRKVMGAVIHLDHQLAYEWQDHHYNTQPGPPVTVCQVMNAPPRATAEDCSSRCRLLVRELLPRVKSALFSYECIIIDQKTDCVSLFQLRIPCKESPDILEGVLIAESGYRFQLEHHRDSFMTNDREESVRAPKIGLYVHERQREQPPSLEGAVDGITVPTVEWLSRTLLPKVVQWSCESSKGVQQGKGKSGLIPLNRYSCLYQEMKDKYAPSLIKNWPENTDPQKYVFEDLAIAAYLLVLWEEERKQLPSKEKQSFVDLGCGNGLLVYILMSEGHPGRGLDLRERGIWKMYGEKANLEVCVLSPSSKTLFPGVDWLIGNHSDELTPWLPVMASRSSYHTRFFVLPCCPHDFNKKFHRQGSSESQYRSYLKYVREIGEKMGFKVQEDTLRIPSSKRICLVGQERTYLSCDEQEVDVMRQQFIDNRCGRGSGQERKCDKEWIAGFIPRESSEPVRNCSHIDETLSGFIVQTIASHLLQGVTAAPEPVGVARYTPQSTGLQCWSVGGSIQISEAARMFDSAVLHQLKKECGGLQTLLRNQHQVFHVRDGWIHIRDWSRLEERDGCQADIKRYSPRTTREQDKQLLRKTKLCWFHGHHPQGCPRAACSYAHGLEELRARPNFEPKTQIK